MVFVSGISALHAQDGTGSIAGTVLDPRANGLAAGTYTVETAATGFGTDVRHSVVVAAGQTAEVSVGLAVASVSEEVTVEAEADSSIAMQNAPVKALLDAASARMEIASGYIRDFTSPVTDFSDIRQAAPGTVTWSSNGIGNGQAKTYYRGFADGNYTMAWDGVPFEDSNDPTHHSWAYVPAPAIFYVDFDRSPGTASDIGPENFGGSIHMFLPKLGAPRMGHPAFAFNLAGMDRVVGNYASVLRAELAARNREWARGRAHVESYGEDPVVVYAPETFVDGGGTVERHGNFYDAAYAAILSRPELAKRLQKAHTGRKDLPRAVSGRKWRELDSCMSSDALLMNFFCAPEAEAAPAVRLVLGVSAESSPVFGWKARVSLKSGLVDRTEVDMHWGDLLVEAKLTEGDFQTRAAAVVEGYRDFDLVFDRELLPRVEAVTARRRVAAEFAEAYSQEWEDTAGIAPEEAGAIAAEYQAGLVAGAEARSPREVRYRSYQLIRNVLAAYGEGGRFCVIADERRPDLKEAWFGVMSAVRSAEMRWRCLMLTWQELASVAPPGLREFLLQKYGIHAAG